MRSLWDCGSGSNNVARRRRVIMTREEAIKKLKELGIGDREISHIDADYIIRKFLESEGYKDVADAYVEADNRIGFLYA